MILALLLSFAMADEPIVEFRGETKTGHQLLYVTVDGEEHVYPVDPEDLNDPEAIAILIDDISNDVEPKGMGALESGPICDSMPDLDMCRKDNE